jgi:hypothetical protein
MRKMIQLSQTYQHSQVATISFIILAKMLESTKSTVLNYWNIN